MEATELRPLKSPEAYLWDKDRKGARNRATISGLYRAAWSVLRDRAEAAKPHAVGCQTARERLAHVLRM